MNQIEKVARALCDDAGCVWDHDPQTLSRAEWRKAACAAIAAMQPAPQEPVAWLYEHPDFGSKIPLANRTPDLCNCGWTETPLYAHPPAQWQGIESAPDLERVIVAGWNPHSGNVRGYWWYGEDVVSNGRAIEHPRATHWRPFNNPAFPTPPAGGSDAE